jgi:hypothetical protein
LVLVHAHVHVAEEVELRKMQLGLHVA